MVPGQRHRHPLPKELRPGKRHVREPVSGAAVEAAGADGVAAADAIAQQQPQQVRKSPQKLATRRLPRVQRVMPAPQVMVRMGLHTAHTSHTCITMSRGNRIPSVRTMRHTVTARNVRLKLLRIARSAAGRTLLRSGRATARTRMCAARPARKMGAVMSTMLRAIVRVSRRLNLPERPCTLHASRTLPNLVARRTRARPGIVRARRRDLPLKLRLRSPHRQ